MTQELRELPREPEDGARDAAVVDRLERIEQALDDPRGRLIGSINDAAKHVRNVTLIHLLVGLYLAILGGTTNHELLFRAGDVQMPLLNVGVPVVGFYVVAPVAYLLLHWNLLLQVRFLAGRVFALETQLEQLEPEEQERVRPLLFPFPFVELALGKFGTQHWGGLRLVLRSLVWAIYCVTPPLLLLWLQIRFLPYQEEWITWLHRIVLTADLLILWLIWPCCSYPSGPVRQALRQIWASAEVRAGWLFGRIALIGAALVTPSVLAFTFLVVVIPLGWPERTAGTAGLADALAERAPLVFSRTLSLRDRVLVAEEPPPELIDDADGEDAIEDVWLAHAEGLDLEGRNFRAATLAGADLTNAILIDADLQNADLLRANLQNATLCDPDRRVDNPGCASLAGATVEGISLRQTKARELELQGADLEHADLQGADLRDANLQGAVLVGANLQGATLFRADLQGALLYSTNLQGADLEDADLRVAGLQGAFLWGANLQTADFDSADLQGAVLRSVDLQGARLSHADLQGTDLRSALLWGTIGEDTSSGFADLRDVRLAPHTLAQFEEGPETADKTTDEEAGQRVRTALERVRIAFEYLRDKLGKPWKLDVPAEIDRRAIVDPWLFIPETAKSGFGPDFMASVAQADAWLAPMSLRTYESRLAEFLTDELACAEDASEALVEGIARRVTLPWHRDGNRPYAALVAKTLLDEEACPPARALDEGLREHLREVAARAPDG